MLDRHAVSFTSGSTTAIRGTSHLQEKCQYKELCTYNASISYMIRGSTCRVDSSKVFTQAVLLDGMSKNSLCHGGTANVTYTQMSAAKVYKRICEYKYTEADKKNTISFIRHR